MKKKSSYENIILLILYEIALYIAPLITAPYIARVLGTRGTGIYSYTYSIASYFILFIQLGVSLYGRREIASQLKREDISKTFWEIFLTNTIMFFITSIVYFVSVYLFFSSYKVYLFYQFMLLISSWLDISWFFFGIEDFKIAISRNLIVKVLSMILVFIVVKEKDDVIEYVLIMSITNLASVLVMWFSLFKNINKSTISVKSMKTHLKQLFVLFIPILAIQLYSITDKVCLGVLGSIEDVGIYENVYKISRVPVAVITAIGTVMLPRITKLIAQGKEKEIFRYINKTLSLTLIVSIGCSFGLIAISEPFIKLYLGNEFLDGIPVLKLLSLVLIIIAWGNVFRMQFILPKKMDNIYIKSVIIGAIINIILNILLIPLFFAVGAAIASVISELLVCIYQSYKIRKFFDLKKMLSVNLKYLISGIAMFSVLRIINFNSMNNIMVSLLIEIILGIILYTVFIILFEIFSTNKVFTDELLSIYRKIIFVFKKEEC